MMNIVVSAIDAEIAVLKEVRALLAGKPEDPRHKGRGRRKRSRMSVEARARIAAAQRKRWATWKKKQTA
jgi:hypothetical protein